MTSNLKNVDVFILCGGLGRRLRKISRELPKPMVKINNRPFLDLVIDYLSCFGFQRFILGTGYKTEVIEDYYRKNKKPGLEIAFSYESKPLGTGGAVKNARKWLKSSPFLVINGDSFCPVNLESFFDSHKTRKAFLSIVLTVAGDRKDGGQVIINADQRITCFKERGDFESNEAYINTGIYLMEKKVFNFMPASGRFSLEKDFLPEIINRACLGYVTQETLIDIGTPERYKKARQFFTSQRKGK